MLLVAAASGICMYLSALADWHTLAVNQAVMIGAGVRTSAESWELNVRASPLSCTWQGEGEHLHETCRNLSLNF